MLIYIISLLPAELLIHLDSFGLSCSVSIGCRDVWRCVCVGLWLLEMIHRPCCGHFWAQSDIYRSETQDTCFVVTSNIKLKMCNPSNQWFQATLVTLKVFLLLLLLMVLVECFLKHDVDAVLVWHRAYMPLPSLLSDCSQPKGFTGATCQVGRVRYLLFFGGLTLIILFCWFNGSSEEQVRDIRRKHHAESSGDCWPRWWVVLLSSLGEDWFMS